MKWLFFLNACRRGDIVSSTRLALVVTVMLTTIVVLSSCFVMVYATIKTGNVTINYFDGIAKVIGSTSVLIGSAGLAKSLSEKWSSTQNQEEQNKKEK